MEKEMTSAESIKAVFDPMTEMLDRLEPEFQKVVGMEQSPEAADEASALLKQIVKVRTTADKKRKEQKDYFLQAGRAIDGAYNILKSKLTPKEEKLKDIKLFEERAEEVRIAELKESREAELEKYDFDGTTMALGTMQDEVWTQLLAGTKSNYENVLLAEQKVKEDQEEEDRKWAVRDARLKKLFDIGLTFNGDSLVYKDIKVHQDEVLSLNDEKFDKRCTEIFEQKKTIDAESVLYTERKTAMQGYVKYGVLDRITLGMSLEEYTELKAEMIKTKRESEAHQKKLDDDAAELKKVNDQRIKDAEERQKKEAQELEDRKEAAAAPQKVKLMRIAKDIYDQRGEFTNGKAINAMKQCVDILKTAAELM